ncbi:MAG: flagellar hook-associated protein 2 [bacterium]|nr:MAG: flagellar hook-associated protein 2 [bacterium]
MTLGTITSLGVGSGLDLQGMLDKLSKIDQLPVVRMRSQLVVLDAKKGAYNDISSKLNAMSGSLNALVSSFDNFKTSSSDTTIATASISGQAAVSSYDLNVTALAKAEQFQSNGFAADTTPLSAGTFSFSIGGGVTYSIATDSDTADSSEPSTPAELTAAINNLKSGATATLINTGAASNPYVIQLSAPSGTANTITINSTPTGVSFTQTQAAADLSMTINGLSVTKSSNNVGDIVTGLQFDIVATGSATISVSNDNSNISTMVKNIVDDYNSFKKTYDNAIHYSSDPRQQGVLMTDGNIKQVLDRVESPFTNYKAEGKFHSLADIGVTRNDDGTYSFDSSKLDTELVSNRDDVKQLLIGDGSSGSDSFFGHLSTVLDSVLSSNGPISSETGLFDTQESVLNTQISQTESFLQKQQSLLEMQFANLDTVLGKLKGIGNYLTMQIDSFTKISGGS